MTKEIDDLFDDEVTTGATLASGTTIGGNLAYHLGNDGQGSGLDAETVDGNDVAVDGDIWSSTKDPAGSILENIQGENGEGEQPQGIAFSSNGSLWYSCGATSTIYEINLSGLTQSKFSTGTPQPSGMDLDSNECIWHVGGDFTPEEESIWKFDKNGNVQQSFGISEVDDGYDIGVESNGCLWVGAEESYVTTSSIYEYDQNGNLQSSFTTPSDFPHGGVTMDSSDSIWLTISWVNETPNPSIYKYDHSGTILRTVRNYGKNFGLAFDSNGSVWTGEYSGSGEPSEFFRQHLGEKFYSLDSRQ
jgi:hypothetical protein